MASGCKISSFFMTFYFVLEWRFDKNLFYKETVRKKVSLSWQNFITRSKISCLHYTLENICEDKI